MTIRGEREPEISQTINGMPMTGLLSGAGSFSQFGEPLTLIETSGADVYPGVAPPDKQGFGTVGGTINYTTKEATDQRYTDFNYGVGSFSTQHVGFEANTGRLDPGDPDSVKALVMYDQSWTNGFVDYTHSQTKNFLANIVKPYNDGLDKAELTIVDNSFHGMVQTSPTPGYITSQDWTGNFAPSEGFQSDANNYFTIIARNEMALSDDLFFDVQRLWLDQHAGNLRLQRHLVRRLHPADRGQRLLPGQDRPLQRHPASAARHAHRDRLYLGA